MYEVEARVVGCFAHIAGVLCYMGYQRHAVEEKSHTSHYKNYVLVANTFH